MAGRKFCALNMFPMNLLKIHHRKIAKNKKVKKAANMIIELKTLPPMHIRSKATTPRNVRPETKKKHAQSGRPSHV